MGPSGELRSMEIVQRAPRRESERNEPRAVWVDRAGPRTQKGSTNVVPIKVTLRPP